MSRSDWTRTTCPYCGVGCGVLAKMRDDGSTEIKGDPDHPANYGRLCSKGSALGETLGLSGRLLAPIIGGNETDWPDALDLVSRKFADAIAAHGPESVALYVSGQILTEDYYVANKLMKGFIGSANIDTNSRLCMASSVAGHKRAFGSDTVPGTYEDLEQADLVVLVGSNLAWCHPVLFQRLAAAREQRGTTVVVIDPRRTATSEIADLHLQIAPGSDVAIFNGLLAHLDHTGCRDMTFVARHTSGLGDALATARSLSFDEIVAFADVPKPALEAFYRLYETTSKSVTVYSQGVNQSSFGTDKVNAIINCHLLTGRIGKPGMGPFSVTGQPNAMGGREVGGLANTLAAHMELADPNHRRIVQTFWGAPHIPSQPGLKAVELFQAVGDGRIKALWIMGTNPVVSLPDADFVKAALAKCPFVVVSDVLRDTDTTQYAHVQLPALAWGEKSGTVTNSERRISRQRVFLEGPGQARADWWQLAEVGKRLGHNRAFDWQDVSEIFAEHASLSGIENSGSRDFDISEHATITAADYDELLPFQWPAPADTTSRKSRFFADGKFFTTDGRARFVATSVAARTQKVTGRLPLILNTGRLRDQWHTMTRTSRSARLMQHVPEPIVEMHPDDITRFGVSQGEFVVVENERGRATARVNSSEAQRAGEIFFPMHWSDQFASEARVGALIAPVVDPISGQPDLKATPVNVRALKSVWHAFGVSAFAPNLDGFAQYSRAVVGGGHRFELAGATEIGNWDERLLRVLGVVGTDVPYEVLAYRDVSSGQHRFCVFDGDVVIGALFVSKGPADVSRTWLIDQLGAQISPSARLRILAGRPGAEARDRGAIVCACYSVGRNDIIGAIVEGGCRSVADVGARTNAGTNCGSCRSEIGRLIHDADLAKTG